MSQQQLNGGGFQQPYYFGNAYNRQTYPTTPANQGYQQECAPFYNFSNPYPQYAAYNYQQPQQYQHRLTQQWQAAIDALRKPPIDAGHSAPPPPPPPPSSLPPSPPPPSSPWGGSLELRHSPGETIGHYVRKQQAPSEGQKQTTLTRPKASEHYLNQANKKPITMHSPHRLLVILDLNGTLLHRPRRDRPTDFTMRPRVSEFLHYLLNNHDVMIWSSAKKRSVKGMCTKLFKERIDELVAIWARDDLRLPVGYKKGKVQVYKQLSWVWQNDDIEAKNPDMVEVWNQENTVLIDDSLEKAASEPYNIVQVEEYKGGDEQSDVLGRVVNCLERLKFQQDVSAEMRCKPFQQYEEDSCDWTPIVNDMFVCAHAATVAPEIPHGLLR